MERTIRSQQAPEERNSLAQDVSAGKRRHRDEPHRGGTNPIGAAPSGAQVIPHGYPALTRWANEWRPSGPSTEELFPDQGSLFSQGSLLKRGFFYDEAFFYNKALFHNEAFKASAVSKATQDRAAIRVIKI